MSLLIERLYHFGEFTVDADQRVLLRGGKPLPLAPKVFDTLLVLVENRGRIVLKEELMSRLWPDTFVEDANLCFNIQQLRKSLGDNARRPQYVETITRRGYRFIAGVEEVLSSGNGRIIERLETSNAQAATVRGDVESGVAAQIPDESRLPTGQIIPTELVSRDPSKKLVALAGTIVLILTGLALVSWRISSRGNNGSSEDKQADNKSLALPLKLEKLTRNGESRYVAISPDGKYLAYTSGFGNVTGIWLRQLTTNTNVEIVSPAGPVYGLAFAYSGEYLYFVRGTPTALYRVSIVGGVPTKLVDGLEGNFSLSTDDTQIVFVRQVVNSDGQLEYSLIIANSDGNNQRTLLSRTHPEKLDVPLWSPDGQSIICAHGSSDSGGQDVNLVEVRISDRSMKAFSSDRFSAITKMGWLPSKRGLIVSARKGAVANQLWRVSYPGTEATPITDGIASYSDVSLAVSADTAVATQTSRTSDIWIGSSDKPQDLKNLTQATDSFTWTQSGQLVYSSNTSGNLDLWIMQPDGTGQRQLTVNAATNGNPAVTSDNRYIVFISNRTGTFQVWRMNIDGSNQIQLTKGVGKNCPAVSPDGKWVVYNSTDDWHLWKVSIDGGEQFAVTDYVASSPAISPDGKMIACVGRNASKRELLILPFEGGAPSKRFDFVGWRSRIQWTRDGKSLIYAGQRNDVRAIMKQGLNGGLSEQPLDLGKDDLFDFGYSPNGQSLAVTRGSWRHDIVLISLNRY